MRPFLRSGAGAGVFAPVFPHARAQVLTPVAGGGGDPGGSIWSGYFTAAGITDATAQSAINTFYDGLVSDGLDSKIKVFVLLGAEAATATNLMQDAYHGSLVNSPTFAQWLGVRGDGATSYWSTGTALGSITGLGVNDTFIGVGAAQDTPDNVTTYNCAYLYVETYTTYEAAIIAPTFNGSTSQYGGTAAVNDDASSAALDGAFGTMSDVRLYASRTGATTLKVYRGTTEILDSNVASVAFPTQPMFGAAYNFDGSPDLSGNQNTFDAKWYCVAQGLNGTEQAALDARIVTLITALEALA